MNREAFLQRVRQAARAGRAYRAPVPRIAENAGYVGAEGSLCEVLAEHVKAAGGEARVVDSWQVAREEVISLLQQYSVCVALCWKHPLLDRLGLPQLLATKQIARHDHDTLSQVPPEEQRRLMLAADIGISSVDLAVAETGSLIVCSQTGQERVASLLPPVHLAIVEESQIVADLFDVFDELTKRGHQSLPSNLVFITGPSKTGDIELQLTTGVHGPGKWHVVVVRVRTQHCPVYGGTG